MSKDLRLGAMWSKKGPKGDYFTGQLEIDGEKISIVVFYNTKKEKDSQPDWHILKSVPREQKEDNTDGTW